MVDALHEAWRVLAARGVFVDARPEPEVPVRVRARTARGRVIGTISTRREARTDDRLSDLAVRTVVGRKLFRSRRRGRLWYAIGFEDFAELRDYLQGHNRFSPRVRWTFPGARQTVPLFIERAVGFEILEKL